MNLHWSPKPAHSDSRNCSDQVLCEPVVRMKSMLIFGLANFQIRLHTGKDLGPQMKLQNSERNNWHKIIAFSNGHVFDQINGGLVTVSHHKPMIQLVSKLNQLYSLRPWMWLAWWIAQRSTKQARKFIVYTLYMDQRFTKTLSGECCHKSTIWYGILAFRLAQVNNQKKLKA